MKTFIKIIAIAILSHVLYSCTKVIDVDLNSTDPKYVIEGVITNETKPFSITIKQSVNFSETNNYPKISGAVVTISDNAGQSETLVESSAGKYTTSSILGIPGRTYQLNVKISDKTFTASSTMPTLVALDSLSLKKSSFGFSSKKVVHYNFNDPLTRGNNYKADLYINRKLEKIVTVFNDRLANGIKISSAFQGQNIDYKSGDTLRVSLANLDNTVFEYFFEISQLSGGPNQAGTPANPTSNISGGALGYFSAQSVSTLEIVYP